jgi:hypothetical protein
MTKDNQRQGMAELLAKQRAGLPLTPSEAARQRRSRQAQAEDLPRQQQATAEQAADAEQEAATGADADSSMKVRPSRVTGIASDPPQPAGRFWRALRPVASTRNALLATACAVAVSLACWLAARRLRWYRR